VYNSNTKNEEEGALAKVSRGLLRALEGAQIGAPITIGGQEYCVAEAVGCEMGDFRWHNLIFRDSVTGKEVVLEIAEGNLRLWVQVEVPGARVAAKVLVYEGVSYKWVEGGIGLFTIHTLEGTERKDVPYSVLRAPSGKRLSVEEIDGKVFVYSSEKGLIDPSTVQVS